MTSQERFVTGATNYVEREVLPHLPELKAIAVAGVVALYAQKVPQMVDGLEKIPSVKVLGVIQDGMID